MNYSNYSICIMLNACILIFIIDILDCILYFYYYGDIALMNIQKLVSATDIKLVFYSKNIIAMME